MHDEQADTKQRCFNWSVFIQRPAALSHPHSSSLDCCLMEAITAKQLPLKLMDCLVHSSETNRRHALFPAVKYMGAVWVFLVNSAVH